VFTILKAALAAVFSVLWGRWFGKPKDPETVEAENALKATQNEATILAAPPRDLPDVLDSMRADRPN
jgi:hypothetical protein